MKLKDVRDASRAYTVQASALVRQLAITGVAVLWIFKDKDQNILPSSTVWPIILLISSLFLDLLQYSLGGIIWKLFADQEFKRTCANEETDVDIPDGKANIIYIIYYAKIVVLVIAYVGLFNFLIRHLKFS